MHRSGAPRPWPKPPAPPPRFRLPVRIALDSTPSASPSTVLLKAGGTRITIRTARLFAYTPLVQTGLLPNWPPRVHQFVLARVRFFHQFQKLFPSRPIQAPLRVELGCQVDLRQCFLIPV